jgi:myo-inositol-1(or 4)-monophosphatase
MFSDKSIPISLTDADRFKTIGINAAQKAGKALLSLFGDPITLGDKSDGDWVTQADLRSDEIIRSVIQSFQPRAHIVSEEDPIQTFDLDEPTWVIDPLDGTHNFMLGIPVFAVCLTLVIGGWPFLSVVNQPFTNQLYVAQSGLGATLNAKKLILPLQEHKNRPDTVCLTLGYQRRREAEVDRLLIELRRRSNRVLEIWVPSLSWCLVAQGKADSIICLHPSKFDSFGGALILSEAGGLVTSLGVNDDITDWFDSSPIALVGSIHHAVHQSVLATLRGYMEK